MNRIIFLTLALLVMSKVSYAQGILKGKVVFEGTPPPVEKVEVKSDTVTCGTVQEVHKIALGAGNGVQDAVVQVLGVSGAVQPSEGNLDQVNCIFVPHVQVLPVASKLKISSSDPVLHNSHGFNEDGSTAFNIAVPVIGMEMPTIIKQTGVIKLRCDAGHTWMSAYVVGVDHPYYAKTDADGNFTIENVPPGEYEIEVWQEWLGKHRERVTVKEGEEPVVITLKEA